MAEINQNIDEHDVIQLQEEDHGLEYNINHGLNDNIEHNLEHNIEHDLDHTVDHDANPEIDHGMDHAVDDDVEHPVDQSLDHTVDQSLDNATDQDFSAELNVDHNLDHCVDHGMDQNVDDGAEQDINHSADQVHEDYQSPVKGQDTNTVAGSVEKKWPGWPGESVFRMLVPAQKVGSIIGRKGEFIKKIVEETRARIKILDGPPGTTERAVMVSGKEEPDSALPPAMDGLLRVHKRIIDGSDGDSSNPSSGTGTKASTRLLVPASQAGSLIGKQGGTVKSIQEASSCVVRVLGSEDLPAFALQDDRVVEVLGDAAGVHKAVELIASHLRKFLVDRSIIPVFEMQMQRSNPPQMEHMPHQSWGPPQGLPPNAGGGPAYNQYMPPPRQMENYYPPAELPPPIEKQPHQGISAYGREATVGPHGSSNAQAAPSMITQITQQMQIPLSYADAVIGTAGANISYIRRASGATVTIQETRGVPGEMTVEISGTASQVQTAQQLIQNFMADAGAPAPVPVPVPTGGSADQGYNPYATHGSVYASPQANAGGYGSVYGPNYGY